MTTPATPTDPTPAGDDRNLIPVNENYAGPTFEDKLHAFWAKNSAAVMIAGVLVILAIVGKGAWDYFAEQREKAVGKDYAAAATPENLKAFAASHSGHTLAAVAQLRLADEAYTTGKTAEALSNYEAAAAGLKTGPFAARAQLGLAITKIQSGKTADGEAALKALANDATQLKGVRTEAAYHLASLAMEAGKVDDVKKYSDQITQIDPSSPWMQRAMMLRSKLPAEAATVQVGVPAAKP